VLRFVFGPRLLGLRAASLVLFDAPLNLGVRGG
jgi:hypothetical protein